MLICRHALCSFVAEEVMIIQLNVLVKLLYI